MKKRSGKKSRKAASKKADKYDMLDKAAITAAVLMILIALGLFYNLGTVGKAVTAPSPPVDLTTQESEDLDLSAYNRMDIEIKLSGESEISEFTLSAEQDGGLTYYHLKQGVEENVFAYGILDANLASSGDIYLNDDNKGDLKLTLQGNLLTATNLNFVAPDVAEFEVYDDEFNKISDDILDAELDQQVTYYFNLTSTSLPLATVLIDGEEALTEEVDSGSNFVLVKVLFTAGEERPYSLTVTANVGGEETAKNYILAVNGYLYELIEQGYAVSLSRENGDYMAEYELEKTSELQPLSLLCGELDLAGNQQLVDGIEKILSYDKEVEQWKENIPSEFETLVTEKGYLFDLKDSTITFTVECGGKPLPQTPILGLGWNLVGTNGYKATKVADLKTSEGDIMGIYQYGDSQLLGVGELEAGMVYWVKVE